MKPRRTLAPVSDSLPSTAFLKKTDRIVGCLAFEVSKLEERKEKRSILSFHYVSSESETHFVYSTRSVRTLLGSLIEESNRSYKDDCRKIPLLYLLYSNNSSGTLRSKPFK